MGREAGETRMVEVGDEQLDERDKAVRMAKKAEKAAKSIDKQVQKANK